MPAPESASVLTLVSGASLPVQIVLALLLAASIISWTMIFRKWFVLAAANRATDRFEDKFWSGLHLDQLYTELNRKDDEARGVENIFLGGYREFRRLSKQPHIPGPEVVQGVQRAMRVGLSEETDYLETHLPFLATVGSTSPYVGLFGTVWGIMNSFHALGGMQQATIAQVAPGIAEALIATAMGLFAAIPAVIAYNRYATSVERLITRYEIFMGEFASIVHRQSFRGE
ncbi:MAG: protein TolQ [Acidiferrobacterales bacterium]|jgi:biopolymer transport protein TolQ|nr:protein TolQ [Acidiferrobacterales bacterium]